MGHLLLMGCGKVAAAGTWVTTFSQALDIDSGSWTGFNMRQHIAASLLSQSGSKFRLTLQSGSGSEGAQISGMYAGHAAGSGDAYDFDGTQVQVTVASSSSFTVAANSTVVTDEITYTFNEASNFIIAAHFNNGSHDTVRAKNAVPGNTNYFKSAASEVATANVTGYSTTANALRLVSLIEVLQP